MEDKELWNEVRRQLTNAPERSAPPGAWAAFEQQLSTSVAADTPPKANRSSRKLLWLLLPLALLLGWLIQARDVDQKLSSIAFPLEIKEVQPSVNPVQQSYAINSDASLQDQSLVNRSAVLASTSNAVTSLPRSVNSAQVRESVVNRISMDHQPAGGTGVDLQAFALDDGDLLLRDFAPAAIFKDEGTEKRNHDQTNAASQLTEPQQKMGLTEQLYVPQAPAVSLDNSLISTAEVSRTRRPVMGSHRITLAAGWDSPFAKQQQPSLHLAYRSSAWLGNLSWMALVSHHQTGFEEAVGNFSESTVNLLPYLEPGTSIIGYRVNQEKIFAGIGLGYTLKIPKTRFSIYPHLSALYLIRNNGEIRIEQLVGQPEMSQTRIYGYTNNDSSPNRYLLQGGLDVQYQLSRRWAGAFTLQRNTTFAMEKANWQLRVGVHYVIN